MHDPEVEHPVVVVIEPACGNGPFAARDARRSGDVFERAVAAIVIKDVAIDAGDEEIGMAVVVVICSGRAHRVAFARDARVFGHVAGISGCLRCDTGDSSTWGRILRRDGISAPFVKNMSGRPSPS